MQSISFGVTLSLMIKQSLLKARLASVIASAGFTVDQAKEGMKVLEKAQEGQINPPEFDKMGIEFEREYECQFVDGSDGDLSKIEKKDRGGKFYDKITKNKKK